MFEEKKFGDSEKFFGDSEHFDCDKLMEDDEDSFGEIENYDDFGCCDDSDYEEEDDEDILETNPISKLEKVENRLNLRDKNEYSHRDLDDSKENMSKALKFYRDYYEMESNTVDEIIEHMEERTKGLIDKYYRLNVKDYKKDVFSEVKFKEEDLAEAFTTKVKLNVDRELVDDFIYFLRINGYVVLDRTSYADLTLLRRSEAPTIKELARIFKEIIVSINTAYVLGYIKKADKERETSINEAKDELRRISK